MTLKTGDRIPTETVFEMGKDGPQAFNTDDLFANKTVLMFGLPGAFTPVCSENHLPGYVGLADQIKARGVDEIFCFAVNDAFVMAAWGLGQNVAGKVRMIGDGSALLTHKMGLELDRIDGGLGIRCQRFAMVIKNGIAHSLDIEAPGTFNDSSAAAQLIKL
ncbi:MAG: peroxiredoxin [Magnetovibrio sp.]|nr:peroxiredoxin [Magnetovibrio sp.]